MVSPPATLTLGELYERQGLAGKARTIYEELARTGLPATREEAARRLTLMGSGAGDVIALLERLKARVIERRRRPQEGI